MIGLDLTPEVGMPTCRGLDASALRRYAVACRASALVADREGRRDLAARLLERASQVLLAIESERRYGIVATA